jgi:protein-tyrosine phosphatase
MDPYIFPVTFIPLAHNLNQKIGISHCPGKLSEKIGSSMQLHSDLKSLEKQRVRCIVTLANDAEIVDLGIENFSDSIATFNFRHYCQRIMDRSVPRVDQSDNIKALLKNILNQISFEKNVLVHCNAGLGRSGLIAALLVKTMGVFPDSINHIRRYRPGAIETKEQEDFINMF